MTFLSPGALYLLLFAPALVAGYVLLQRRRRAYIVRFTNLELLASVAPRTPRWKRHVAPALMLLTLVLLVGALARPFITVKVPRERSSVVLVLDVSRSMSATDLKPDRMGAAREAASEFVTSVPKELRIGAVAFSDTAALVAPLTHDREHVTAALAALRPIAGTAVGDGLDAALIEIRRQRATGEDVPAAVLLLSDGASNRGRPSAEVAQEAAAMEVPVYAVGVGTEGATLELNGRQVPVDLDEEELQGIAEATGGSYFKTGDADALSTVYRDLGSELGYVEEEREATAVAAGIAMLFLLGAVAASLLWFQRIP